MLMGSQIPSSGDGSRTFWTPVMTQIFVDLMLDHVHRGNRSGHTFNKQAWNDMLTVFNAKFRSSYEKDVLKSCYTSLWKQYNDIKVLLDQTGFSWNSTQQMVVADGYVWDAYIKAHPDAGAYRDKALTNFDDLYLIFAYTTADGRFSRSSHDADLDDDFQGMNFVDGMGSPALASNDCSKADWAHSKDQYLIELMLGEVKKGNKVNNTFKKHTWMEMVASFNLKFCSQHSKRDLKMRYNNLWKYYSDVKTMLEEGFVWDEKKQMLAADDSIWESYIKVHPNAQAYRKKTLLNYQDLSSIYGSSVSNLISDYSNPDEGVQIIEGEDPRCLAENGNSMTDWTPSMDRYFIDLMLVQVHKGNRIDSNLSKQIWLDMVTSFQDMFGPVHDINSLRSRCESLRRLYHDMKNLLDQGGFSWDEMQQRVTAHENVWDAYVKEHPGAKSFRTEKKPNYNDLCLIYGSRVGGCWESVSDVCGGPMADWTPQMDRRFIDLMLEEAHKGGLVDCKFITQAWIDVVSKFDMQFGSLHSRDILMNRFLDLKRCFNALKSLLDQTGFAWDEMRQMVTADDDRWNAYVKENPDAAAYRSIALPNYNDLFLIYGHVFTNDCPDNHGNGATFGEDDNHSPGTSNTSKAFVDLVMENNRPRREVEIDGILGDMQCVAWDIERSIHRKRRRSVNPSTLSYVSKLHKSGIDGKQQVHHEMVGVSSTSASDEEEANYGSIESIVDALQVIPDMSDEIFLEACKLLEDENKARMFVSLDVEQRKMWLLEKLFP